MRIVWTLMLFIGQSFAWYSAKGLPATSVSLCSNNFCPKNRMSVAFHTTFSWRSINRMKSRVWGTCDHGVLVDDELPSSATSTNNHKFIDDSMTEEIVLQLLTNYHNLYHTLDVPKEFIVPSRPLMSMFEIEGAELDAADNFQWPDFYTGYPLGKEVYRIRRHIPPDSLFGQQLTQIGFIWDISDFYWQQLHAAVIAYAAHFPSASSQASCSIPMPTFVIPKHDITWPKITWNMAFGKIIAKIRSGNIPKPLVSRQSQVEALLRDNSLL